MVPRWTKLGIYACVAAMAVVAGACATKATEEAPGAPGAAGAAGGGRGGGGGAVPVTVAAVVQRPVQLQFTAVGTAEAYSSVAVHAQITGEVTSVGFKEGDDIKAGQVLFVLDHRPLEAALEQAKANLARDTAQLANATSQAERYQELADRGIATREQIDQTRASAAALDATVQSDRAALDNATVQLQYATIRSTLAGRTGALMVHAGNLVRANDATPLVVINQVSPINVSFGVPEGQLSDLKRFLAQGSATVEVSLPDDTTSTRGQISFVDNAVDQTTGTIKVKGTFLNSNTHLWPGQFLNVTVTLRTDPQAIVVPSRAVQTRQEGPYVYVVKPNRTVDLRPVDVDRAAGDDTVIKSGLSAGEIVVTDGQLRLVPGSQITIRPAQAAAVSTEGS